MRFTFRVRYQVNECEFGSRRREKKKGRRRGGRERDVTIDTKAEVCFKQVYWLVRAQRYSKHYCILLVQQAEVTCGNLGHSGEAPLAQRLRAAYLPYAVSVTPIPSAFVMAILGPN